MKLDFDIIDELEEEAVLPRGKSLSGKIVRLFCSTPNFSAGVIKSLKTGEAKFAGKVMVGVSDQVKFIGYWKKHAQYGWQFQVSSLIYDMELNASGIAHYLTTNPAFKGIGPVKAEKIAKHFGNDFDRVLKEEPKRLQQVAKLSHKDLEILQREWESRKQFNALSTWLAMYELTHHQITRLVERFGHNVKAILKKDPYLLCREIKGFGFARTDQIALKLGISKNLPGRIQAALLHIVAQRADSEGHCWTEEMELIELAAKILALDDMDFRERVDEQLDCLLEEKKLIGHQTGERSLIASPTLYEREMELARIFAQSRNNSPEIFSDKELSRLLETEASDLNPSQQQAVRTALTSRVSVISGAGGTGKSYSIAAICRICEEHDLEVALAAPTGKAAKRMEELADCEAKTIHRLLKYNGQTWEHDAGNLLEYDVIILDEVSMTDIHLAWRFFQAVDLSTAQVILVGDHNQLPPVGPGNILRDLIDRRLLPTVILDQVVRQAGILKENCTALLTGRVRPTSPGRNGLLRPWYVIDGQEKERQALTTLLQIVEYKLASLGIDPVKDLQIITPLKKGLLGTANLNIELQRLIQRLRFGVEVDPVPRGKRPKFYLGDKLMQHRNNYRLGVMNGTVGFVKDICKEKDREGKEREVLKIDFDGRTVTIPANSEVLRDLQLAYSCTIHKFQGSEIPCALTIVHSSHYFMLHRNLLYTAVTRAQKVSIILGNRKGINAAAARLLAEKRKTFLSAIEISTLYRKEE